VRAPRRPGARGARQVLTLGNERFMVPEVAFRPSDLGVAQGGLAQAAAEAAAAAHPDLRPLLLRNVVAVGGLARCPGFAARLAAELRALVPDELEARPPPGRPRVAPTLFRPWRRPRASWAAAALSRIEAASKPEPRSRRGCWPLAHGAARCFILGSRRGASRPTVARRRRWRCTRRPTRCWRPGRAARRWARRLSMRRAR